MLRSKCDKLLFSVIIFLYFKYSLALTNSFGSRLKINQELPLAENLGEYLQKIESAVKYYESNESEIDISLGFGLFLSNVNIGRALRDKKDLPIDIKTRLEKNILYNNKLLRYFRKISNNLNFMTREFIQISKLFTNSTHWVSRLSKLIYHKQELHNIQELENKYGSWKGYLEAINDVTDWIPDPKFSDMCLVSLAINPSNQKKELAWCPIVDSCYRMLKNGSDFGYALQHRIVLLKMAHLGRGCTILSQKEDSALMDDFCTKSYAEAQYIALNNYDSGDLMLEIMCLCALDGRAEFLQRLWLQNLSDFQTSQGCFGNDIDRRLRVMKTHGTRLRSGKYKHVNPWQEGCNSHTTGLALATFSTAIRYIIQEYY